MEAWMLGDEKAVLAAYPDANRAILRSYDQDSICGTWEVLARAIHGAKAEQIIRLGYPAVGQ
jgi:iron-sulfur cluster repair protein YtfE (RIC family)